jgi:hypothetical protein
LAQFSQNANSLAFYTTSGKYPQQNNKIFQHISLQKILLSPWHHVCLYIKSWDLGFLKGGFMYSAGNNVHTVNIGGRKCEIKEAPDKDAQSKGKLNAADRMVCEGTKEPITGAQFVRVAERATGQDLENKLFGVDYNQLGKTVQRLLPDARMVMGMARGAIKLHPQPVELTVTNKEGKKCSITFKPAYMVNGQDAEAVSTLKRNYVLVHHPKIKGYLIALEMRNFETQIHKDKDFVKEFRALRV